MLYDTVAEYNDEIRATRRAISRVLLIGQSHKDNAGGVGIDTTEERLASLREHLALLIQERNSLENGGFIRMEAGW